MPCTCPPMFRIIFRLLLFLSLVLEPFSFIFIIILGPFDKITFWCFCCHIFLYLGLSRRFLVLHVFLQSFSVTISVNFCGHLNYVFVFCTGNWKPKLLLFLLVHTTTNLLSTFQKQFCLKKKAVTFKKWIQKIYFDAKQQV